LINYLQAAKAPFRGGLLCLSDPELRKLSTRPILVGLFSWPLSIAFALYSHSGLVALIDSGQESWWAPIWDWLAYFMAAGILFGLSFLVSISLVFVLSGVYQASIAKAVFEKLGVSMPGEELGIASETGRTIWVETAKLFWIVPLTCIAFLLGLLPFLTPIALIVTSWLLGFQFLDIALDNLKIGAFQRIRICLKHFLKTAVFGGVLVVGWAVPFLGILIAPGAAAGAALLLAESGMMDTAEKA